MAQDGDGVEEAYDLLDLPFCLTQLVSATDETIEIRVRTGGARLRGGGNGGAWVNPRLPLIELSKLNSKHLCQ